MTQPEQPGAWSEPTWPASPPPYPSAPPFGQPSAPPAAPDAQPTVGLGYGDAPQGYPEPPQGYTVPAYPAAYGYGAPGPYTAYGPAGGMPPTTNGLAIASLICSLAGIMTCGISALVGAILGHVAKRQIRERGDAGAGLATAGVISGWIIFGLHVVLIIVYGVFIVWMVRNQSNMTAPAPAVT